MRPRLGQGVFWYWVMAGGTVAGLSALWLWGSPGRVAGSYAEGYAHRPPSYTPFRVSGLDHADVQGRGVTVGHVEGSAGDYLPNTRDSAFADVRLTPRSGMSKVNSHTVSTARLIYGPSGLAPGIDDVRFYTTAHWMGPAVLRTGTSGPPNPDGRRLFTHSWIGPSGAYANNVLRRVDYLVDVHDIQVVVGVNNGASSPVPALLASSYNSIAVGKANGDSSGGYTRHEGAGRCKPDIVAGRSTTSQATPVVAAAVARLLEAADHVADSEVARQSEVIKAVLLAGAAKPDGWRCESGRPLDEHLGAGVVRFSYSYAILGAGRVAPGPVGNAYGWDFRQSPPDGDRVYGIELAGPTGELSVVLTWHRRVDGRTAQDLVTGDPKWLDVPRLADLNLRLVRRNDLGQAQMVAASESGVDNVEHIYLSKLEAGSYELQVTRRDKLDEAWDYAIAWRIEAPPQVNGN